MREGRGGQGAHPEAVDMEAHPDAQQDPEKLEAKRILNAKVSAYTLEAGVIIHRCPPLPQAGLSAVPPLHRTDSALRWTADPTFILGWFLPPK